MHTITVEVLILEQIVDNGSFARGQDQHRSVVNVTLLFL